eukprot:EG_transcript_5223
MEYPYSLDFEDDTEEQASPASPLPVTVPEAYQLCCHLLAPDGVPEAARLQALWTLLRGPPTAAVTLDAAVQRLKALGLCRGEWQAAPDAEAEAEAEVAGRQHPGALAIPVDPPRREPSAPKSGRASRVDMAAEWVLVADEDMPFVPSEVRVPSHEGGHILDDALVAEVYCSLPPRCRCVDTWTLVHCTLRDGNSFLTMWLDLEKCSRDVLMLVKALDGQVFGAFMAVVPRVEGLRYMGNGEAFVFAGRPQFRSFGWSEQNTHFCFCTERSLGVGGGTAFALLFDGTLDAGSSGPCDTFASPPLLAAPAGGGEGQSVAFEVACIEFWAVGEVLAGEESEDEGGTDPGHSEPSSPENSPRRPKTDPELVRRHTSLRNVKLSVSHRERPSRPQAPLQPLCFVLCLDSSDHSTRAAGFLALQARRDDTVHIYTAGPHTTCLQRAKALFANMDEFHVSYQTDEPSQSSAVVGIMGFAERVQGDVVVLGSRGQTSALRKMFMGSVSTAVVQHCLRGTLSAWVIHQPPVCWPPSYLLCIDGSEAARRATDILVRLLTDEARVLIYSAYNQRHRGPAFTVPAQVEAGAPGAGGEAARDAPRLASLRWCLDANRRFLDAGVLCTASRIVQPARSLQHAAQLCIRLAEAERVGTIVCGFHGHLRAQRGTAPYLGSFASHILNDAVSSSVLLVN